MPRLTDWDVLEMGKHFIVFAVELNSEVDPLFCRPELQASFCFFLLFLTSKSVKKNHSHLSSPFIHLIKKLIASDSILIFFREKFREFLVNIEKGVHNS